MLPDYWIADQCWLLHQLISSSTLTEGSFSGLGQANDSVFERERQANAFLDLNQNGFTQRLSAPLGTGA